MNLNDTEKTTLGFGLYAFQAIAFFGGAYLLELLTNSFMDYSPHGFHISYLQTIGVLYFLPRLLGRK